MKVVFKAAGFGGETIDTWGDAQCIPRVGDKFMSQCVHYGATYIVKEVRWISSETVHIILQGPC